MRAVIHGIVQGVGFRPAVHRIARAMGVNGYVQNNGSNVVVVIDGDAEEFMDRLTSQLPPLARLDRVDIDQLPIPEGCRGFHIVPSGSGERGVGIPTDTAICDRCLDEMFDPSSRRYLYPFTNCTDCGARFTVIRDLPYDRPMTSMASFPRCAICEKEYTDIDRRRFHHQTISCPDCGPGYRLIDSNGKMLEGDPIASFARRLEEGAIGVAKSWGGMHICSTLDTIPHLREWYGREQKPFAIMVRDLDAVRKYGRPTGPEVRELTSVHRPIVLVDRAVRPDTEMVSPGLHNIGMFLPYAGMHHVLFHHLNTDAVVMTSANVPGEPMLLHDEDVMSLGADVFLLHDREILNRADDSVLRMHGDHRCFIRKSRGHTPGSLDVKGDATALGVGAMENLTASLSTGRRLFSTQHIGDGDHIGVIEFLEGAISHLRGLLGADSLDAVAMDLHPGYTNRSLAKRLAMTDGAEIVEVQHHWAHAASLMVDRRLDEVVAITLDGTGYGADGNAWGGEVIHATMDGFERVGHLQEVPLLGGERAVRDPRRLLFAFHEMLGRRPDLFPERDSEVLAKMMDRSVRTSSFGRLMDMVSCHTGTCCDRTYDGEPAMKLERVLLTVAPIDVAVPVRGGTVMTVEGFANALEMRGDIAALGAGLLRGALQGLVDIAADKADSLGLDAIGITGGVSYNAVITDWAESMLSERGLRLLRHQDVPNGDGGISVGQCAIALRRAT